MSSTSCIAPWQDVQLVEQSKRSHSPNLFAVEYMRVQTFAKLVDNARGYLAAIRNVLSGQRKIQTTDTDQWLCHKMSKLMVHDLVHFLFIWNSRQNVVTDGDCVCYSANSLAVYYYMHQFEIEYAGIGLVWRWHRPVIRDTLLRGVQTAVVCFCCLFQSVIVNAIYIIFLPNGRTCA